MTVVRGQAARLLMRRAAPERQTPPQPADWTATLSTLGPAGADDACAFVARELRRHLLAERVADATLVVNELVSNAHQHGRGPEAVTISRSAAGLLLEVSDTGGERPKLTRATRLGSVAGELTGREQSSPERPGAGLKIVSLLSRDWGVQGLDRGKTVWALLHERDDLEPGSDVGSHRQRARSD